MVEDDGLTAVTWHLNSSTQAESETDPKGRPAQGRDADRRGHLYGVHSSSPQFSQPSA
jgi:hypothetical protein